MYDMRAYRFRIYSDVNASINILKRAKGLCSKLRSGRYDFYSTTASRITEPRTYFADAESPYLQVGGCHAVIAYCRGNQYRSCVGDVTVRIKVNYTFCINVKNSDIYVIKT